MEVAVVLSCSPNQFAATLGGAPNMNVCANAATLLLFKK